MPFTFLSHQAAVLPLKVVRPAWFDGAALVLGSMGPDMAYVLLPELRVASHSFAGILYWSVPMTLSLLPILRHGVAPGIAVYGPARLAAFAHLAHSRHPWWKTAACAGFGALTHVLWDGTTHPEGTFVGRWSLLKDRIYETDRALVLRFSLLHHGSSIVGALLSMWLLARYAGRLPTLPRPWPWSEEAARSYRLTVVVFGAAGLLFGASSFADGGPEGAVIRAATLFFVGLLVAQHRARIIARREGAHVY